MKTFYHFVCAIPSINRHLWPTAELSEDEAKNLAIIYKAKLILLAFNASGDLVSRKVLLK